MSKEFTGSGDPRRSMELLWGAQAPGKRGPKPRLSVDEIVQAAIAVADAEGLEALSMRRVAQTVGVSTMSLYTYAPSKAELIDVMLDRVLGEGADPSEAPGGWRAKLEFMARQDWERCHRHPWILQVGLHRPPLGPNLLGKYEALLRILEGLGLTDLEMDQVGVLIMNYVQGAVRQAVEAVQVRQRTGLSDEQWWLAQEPWLEQVLTPGRFPLASRVGHSVGEAYKTIADPAMNFEFGLQRVLDGVEAFVNSRTGAPPPSSKAG
ncbi:MAG: TetR/AcrR family transcriptional regulator [Phenylobacterium sp.]|uniref:TetR/AcrR family transcriptional regulator n=1 Tax=Phenylobacterium sp. TaxID=1871053 RepID=UPI00391D2915